MQKENEIRLKANNKEGIAETMHNMGYSYYYLKNYKKAIQYYILKNLL